MMWITCRWPNHYALIHLGKRLICDKVSSIDAPCNGDDMQALIIESRIVLTLGGDLRSPLRARGSYSRLVRPENENTLELDLMNSNLHRIIQTVALASEKSTSVVFESL